MVVMPFVIAMIFMVVFHVLMPSMFIMPGMLVVLHVLVPCMFIVPGMIVFHFLVLRMVTMLTVSFMMVFFVGCIMRMLRMA